MNFSGITLFQLTQHKNKVNNTEFSTSDCSTDFNESSDYTNCTSNTAENKAYSWNLILADDEVAFFSEYTYSVYNL